MSIDLFIWCCFYQWRSVLTWRQAIGFNQSIVHFTRRSRSKVDNLNVANSFCHQTHFKLNINELLIWSFIQHYKNNNTIFSFDFLRSIKIILHASSSGLYKLCMHLCPMDFNEWKKRMTFFVCLWNQLRWIVYYCIYTDRDKDKATMSSSAPLKIQCIEMAFLTAIQGASWMVVFF